MAQLWVTRYALTEGIKRYKWDGDESDKYVVLKVRNGRLVVLGRSAFKTEAEAKVAAEKMRVKKIASLRKQIAKLETMRFE